MHRLQIIAVIVFGIFNAIISMNITYSNCTSEILALEFSENRITTPTSLPYAPQYYQPCDSNIPYTEYTALEVFYSTTNGPSWTWNTVVHGSIWNFTSNSNQLNYPNPCQERWQGLLCVPNSTRHDNHWNISHQPSCNIAGIILPHYGLKGPIPSDITNFESLTTLILTGNSISGTILPQLFSLTNLTVLDLNLNALSKTIPTTLGNLEKLSYLGLGGNSFTSTLPTTVGLLTNMIELWIYETQLSGGIPSELGQLKYMKNLALDSNMFSQTIPSALGNIPNLLAFALNSNILTGTIPSSLSALTTLTYLYLYSNNLHGTLPSSLGALSSLAYLCLQDNYLSGLLPAELGKLKSLRFMYLFSNHFVGSIPSTFSSLTSMLSLLLSSNSLSGTIGAELAPMQCLLYLDLGNNHFTGSVPYQPFLLPSIISISMAKNSFMGSIPSQICGAGRSLSSIALDGLSSSSHKLSLFDSYTIHYMKGSIPPCIFSLPGIVNLTMQGNGFTGTLPSVNLSHSLKSVTLGYNRITGTIPVTFQRFPFFSLRLPQNHLSGTCDQMGDFFKTTVCAYDGQTNCQSGQQILELYVNRLSGPFPTAAFHDAGNINILTGNMLDCSSTAEFPVNDPGKINGECGSENIQNAFIGYFVALVIAVVILRVTISAPSSQSIMKSYITCHNMFRAVDKKNRFPHTYTYYIVFMEQMRLVAITLALFIILVFIPVFTFLKLSDTWSKMMTFQYRWLPSLAYIQSGLAIYTVLVAFVLLVLFATGQLYRLVNMTNVTSSKTAISLSLNLRTSIFIYMVNASVIGALNYGYLTSLLHSSYDTSIAVGALLAGFKVAWNTMFVSSVVKRLIPLGAKLNAGGTVTMQIILILTNNIFIPIMINMAVSPACFADLLTKQEQLTVTVLYPICTFYGVQNGQCLQAANYYSSNTFTPPFIYSYQCGSALLRAYVPVYVAMYSYITFINPFLALALVLICKWFHGYDVEYKRLNQRVDRSVTVTSNGGPPGVGHGLAFGFRDGEAKDEEAGDVKVGTRVMADKDCTGSRLPSHVSKKDIDDDTFDIRYDDSSTDVSVQAVWSRVVKRCSSRCVSYYECVCCCWSRCLSNHQLHKLLTILFSKVPQIFFPASRVVENFINSQVAAALATVSPATETIQSKPAVIPNPFRLHNNSNFTANLYSNLIVLLSFGSAYPPLSLLVSVAIVVETYLLQILMGRFLDDLERTVGVITPDAEFPYTFIEQDVEGLCQHRLNFGIPLLSITVLSGFYAYFVNDMAGHTASAAAPLIVTLLPPIFIIITAVMRSDRARATAMWLATAMRLVRQTSQSTRDIEMISKPIAPHHPSQADSGTSNPIFETLRQVTV